ncbi:helix-turn-helix domain-containing protein [Streptomyces sp. NPDC048338]|uniref:helix-turn-helix domain-containing protein n=1 Tax=Streptomyces sp. NPDC048338 TaxID=3365536 RepID=UPI003713B988
MNRDPGAWARLGHALRAAREHRGLTQAELGALADVSARSVQDAEAGTVPKARMPYTLGRIASALEWPPGSIEDVLGGGGVPGGWAETSVQKQVDEERLGQILTSSMVHNIAATTEEIANATAAALDALRREGLI